MILDYRRVGTKGTIEVRLDGRVIGRIKRFKTRLEDGWTYWPKGGQAHGEVLPTVAEVQKTLEAD